MRKLLTYSFVIGMSFIGVHISYAQYLDGKVLLERLGIKIDKDGKPVADGSGGSLPNAWNTCNNIRGKLVCLSADDETALKERRWRNDVVFSARMESGYSSSFIDKVGMVIPKLDFDGVVDLFSSSEFLTGVFGEDFVSEILAEAADGEKMIYTRLYSEVKFAEYDSLWDKYESVVCDCGDRHGVPEEVKEYVRCAEMRSYAEEKMNSYTAELEEVLKKHVPQNGRWKSLWEKFGVFRNLSVRSDPAAVRAAEGDFLRELGHVSGLQKNDHPVRISLVKLRTFLPEYLKSSSDFLEACRKFECYNKREEKRFEERLGSDVEEYRKRFGDKGICEYSTKSFPISTEPLTVDVRIYQYHYEDENGTRKLYTEEWEELLTDLDINLHLIIDSCTKKLVKVFFEDKFVVNSQVVTDFGKDGLCIFKSEQSQGFVEEKK